MSSEILTNFGKSMGQSAVDPERLREAGEYVSLGFVKTADIAAAPRG